MENISTLNKVMIFCLLIFLAKPLYTQDIIFDHNVPTDLEVCGSTENFSLQFTNESNATITDISILISLPTGINYEGGLSETSSYNVQAEDVSNSTALLFSADDLPNNQSITFLFSASADFTAMNQHQSGAVFRNIVTVNYNADTSAVDQTGTYNIIYPALSIIEVNDLSQSAYVGEVFSRTVKIINGGYGKLASFIVKDIYDSNLSLLSSDLGMLNNAGDEITLSSSDFQTVGNGDNWLDRNESITITETFQVLGCSDVASEIYATWGCGNETENSNKEFPYTTVSLFLPNLAITPSPSFNTCLEENADVQQLSLVNNGSGPANGLSVTISQNETYEFSRVDINSISYQINGGGTTALLPSSSTAAYNSGDYACLGNDAKKAFVVDLPDLAPGDTYTLTWDSYTCASDFCGDLNLIGWNYTVDYEDACQSNTYSDDGNGQETKSKAFSFFVENPTDLSDGQLGTYNFIISSAELSLPEGSNSYIEARFDIPVGLDWSGNASDLVFKSGTSFWTPASITFSNQQLRARYSLPVPFTLTRSEFSLQVTANCTAGSDGYLSVGMQLFYGMDDSCTPASELPLSCVESANTFLHCPGVCDEGLSFQSFSVARTSFGQPDNDQDGLPDSSGALDANAIKAQRVMVGDTFATTFYGTVKTSASYPSWEYAYANSSLPNGSSLSLIGVSLEVYDNSTGQTLTCDAVPYSESGSSPKFVEFDFSIATLVANACSDFAAFQYEDGDQITLIPQYKVTGNIGGTVEQILITNEFYLSDIANPSSSANQFQCETWAGNLTMIGYYFLTKSNNNYSVNVCTKTVKQSYYLSIGNCCTNYAGGDLFPFEYRNWAHIKTLTVDVPSGYSVSSMKLEQKRTLYTNGTTTETVSAINPISISDTTYTFDLSQYLVSNGGNINRSDDGFEGTVSMEVSADCAEPQGVNTALNWNYYFQESDFLGGAISAAYTGNDKLKYNRANIETSATQSTKNGIQPTVTWDIKVKNTSTKVNANNSWIHCYAPTWDIEVIEVMDLSDNSILTKVGDFYQLGKINKNTTNNYRITATYDRCAIDELIVYSGYDCTGYPSTFANTPCEYNNYSLYVNPQEAEMQVRIAGSSNTADACNPVVSTSIDILSAKLAYVKNIWVEVEIPATQSILMVAGSVEKEYPQGSSPVVLSSPTLTGNVYYFSTTAIDATIAADGLVGVSDISANEVSLNFDLELQENFTNGERLEIRVGALEACGDTLTTIVLQYDPNAVFGQLSGIGMDEAEDNWGTAWGDYDNDGDSDLFVSNYATDKANLLYRNNGDATFTLMTIANITTDLASSIGATWGDYDNDGDLDLYVSNNIGYANFLYRNNGDATFTSIQNDPIVAEKSYSHGVSWGDYDNDGFLDLFVAEFFSTRFNLLYHNNGDGTFTKVLNNLPSQEAASSVAGIWGDYDLDGDVDLFVANTNGENNSLYRNEGNGVFTAINSGAIVTDGGKSVGASWGDIDNDGDLDLFVANSGEENNFLYQNNNDGTFTKVLTGNVVTDEGNSHGSAFGDYDNDGDLDLLVTNDGDDNNFLYANNGDGTFSTISNAISSDGGNSFGAAWADYDSDGDLDVFVANHGSASTNFFYDNERGSCFNSACIQLSGTNSNASAIGARVSVLANVSGQASWQTRYVSGQTGGGLSGQNDLTLHFGLGDATQIDSVIISWPSGYVQLMGSQSIANCLSFTEENGSEICGVAYYDENGNCSYDVGEILLANATISIQPGDLYAYTDELGAYSFFMPPGTYTIEETNLDAWNLSCPNPDLSYTLTVSQAGEQFCNNDFGHTIGSTCPSQPDLKVNIATTSQRVGFEGLTLAQYQNNGTATAAETWLSVDFGVHILPVEASIAWDSVSGTTYFWNLQTVSISENTTIFIKDSILLTATIGDTAQIISTIISSTPDCNTADDSYTAKEIFTGPIDPNDILVEPEGEMEPEQFLTYKIRFQNVGNSAVQRVRLVDELPEELDVNTLDLGIASHPYRFYVEAGNRLIWEFDNIQLPDSTTNELESHGFAIFRIQAFGNLPPGSIIDNQAIIYFDAQAGVETNTVRNTTHKTTRGRLLPGQLSLHPNPCTNTSIVKINPREANSAATIKTIRMFTLQGQLVFRDQTEETQEYTLHRQQFPIGCYLLHLTDTNGNFYATKILLQ